MTKTPPQVAVVLPAEARAMLQRAARVEPSAANPMGRQIAIEQAIAKVKMQFPQFFVSEI